MLEISVKKQGGDYSTITEAIQAAMYEEKTLIHIGEGVFHEKIFCEKSDISFIGEGIDKTIIEFDDGAFEEMEDGSKRGTFRTATAFFGGKRVVVKNMTIKNTVGDGYTHGQALAVYADSDECYFENVKMTGCQDTLFCAPLPLTERQKNGFMGPRVLNPRKKTKQYYKNCEIYGDVDFIFGGADAVFDDCFIQCNNRKLQPHGEDNGERFINGYITAACGSKYDLGFVFRNCTVKGEDGCDEASVFLGRPWRDEAKTVFLDCKMDKTVAPERFSGWGGITKDEPTVTYGEYNSREIADDSEISLSQKNSWIKDIDSEKYKDLMNKADQIVKLFN